MKNVLIIAKKEFTNLLNSNVMIISLFTFVLLILLNIQAFPEQLNQQIANGMIEESNAAEASLKFIFNNITNYSIFVGVIIGVSCIALEKQNDALGLLVTKPLYRDTVINGKIIGVVAFLLVLLTLAILFDVSGIFIVCGNAIMPNIVSFVFRLPLILFLSLIFTMVYVSISIAIATVIKRPALALIFSVFVILLSNFIWTYNFGITIADILNKLYGLDVDSTSYLIMNISPTGAVHLMITQGIFNPVLNISDIIRSYGGTVAVLILELVIFTVVCYISFLRMDIQ